MDKTEAELNLEQRLKGGKAPSRGHLLNQLLTVYDEVIGVDGMDTFERKVFPLLIKEYGVDTQAVGLMALELIDEASWQKAGESEGYLKKWAAEKIRPGKSDIGPLERIALASPEEGVNLTNPDYTSPILLYSNDSRFKPPSANWSQVYRSSTANRSHWFMLSNVILEKEPSIERVIGAESSRIRGRVHPAGYVGDINGNGFNTTEGNDPLIISHGVLSQAGYKHSSNREYGFLYMVTSQGTTHTVERSKINSVEVPAVTAVFAVLPRQNYEEMVEKQFRDAEQFVLSMLPDNWKSYLTEGGFFSKPKVIGRIDAKSPHLNYVPLR